MSSSAQDRPAPHGRDAGGCRPPGHRHHPLPCRSGTSGAKRIAANASDAARLTEIARGTDALFNSANPKYHRWPGDWPPLATAMLSAAQSTGAVLVTLGNAYGYGPVGRPMTEDLPLATIGRKGRVRAQTWRDALAAPEAGRARDRRTRPPCS